MSWIDDDGEKFLFMEIFQLTNEIGILKLENNFFLAIPNKQLQWMFI